MSRKWKRILIPVAAVLLIAMVFNVFSRLYYHRSAIATAIEYYYRLKNVKAKYTDEAYADWLLEKKRQAPEKAVQAPDDLKCEIREDSVDGCQLFTLIPEETSDTVVIYLHGGAYVHNPNSFQWDFADRLARRAQVTVMIPIYPLAPKHTFEEAYAFLDDVYAHTGGRVILMGDSAGGGLAAGFCEHLSEKGLTQPEKLILFSPCLDGTFSNPDIAEYEDIDVLLGVYGLKQICSVWAGDADAADYHVSPINGNVDNLQNVTIFIGNRDLFYPDNVRFYGKMLDAGVNCHLITGNGMQHDYVLLSIPEAWFAMNDICEIIAE